MGSTSSLKYYQLSTLFKWKHCYTQVNRNKPQNSALLGDTSEARSQGPPGDGQCRLEHKLALGLWLSQCLVCYRSVLPLANEACPTSILEVSEKVLLPRTLWKKAMVSNVSGVMGLGLFPREIQHTDAGNF